VVPGEALVTYTLVEQTGTTIGFSRLEGLLATAAASR
jgi:hypothetical protein